MSGEDLRRSRDLDSKLRYREFEPPMSLKFEDRGRAREAKYPVTPYTKAIFIVVKVVV